MPEVRFKISGDNSGLASSFRQSESMAEASGRKMEQALKRGTKIRQNLTPAEARAADREYARGVALTTAERNLAKFRKNQQFDEATTSGKIRIVTNELADLSRKRAVAEAGSTKQLELQLAIEQKMVGLRKLQREQQRGNLSSGSGPTSPAEEKKSGGSGLSPGQLAFRAVGSAIAFALERVINFNQSRVRVAEAQEQGGAVGLGSLRSTLANIGGLQGQLTQGRGALKDLESRKAFEENRARELGSGLQGAVSLLSPEELTKSEEAVARLNGEIQAQHNTNQLIERDLKRQLLTYDNQKTAISETAQVYKNNTASAVRLAGIEETRTRNQVSTEKRLGTPESVRAAELENQQAQLATQLAKRQSANSIRSNEADSKSIDRTNAMRRKGLATEVQIARVEFDRAKTQLTIEKKTGNDVSVRGASLEVKRTRGELNAAQQRLRQQLPEVNQELSGQAAAGRTFADGRPRPLSETERLARRALKFRERARSQALTGAGGNIGDLMAAAGRDEASVAHRLSAATAGVRPKDVADSASIKPEIVRSNQLLEAIKNSLASTDLD